MSLKNSELQKIIIWEKKRKVKCPHKVQMRAELIAHNTSGNVFLYETI